MILNLGTGISKTHMPPVFTHSNNNYRYVQTVASNGVVNWEIFVTGSVQLTFSRVVPVDIFLVGGGMPGSNGSGTGENVAGGNGGAGGERITVSNISLTEGTPYTLTIGGSGGNTTGFGYTARAGYGSAGGAGAEANGSNRSLATGGSNGALPFGSNSTYLYTGWKFGAGGGGAFARNSLYVTANGTNSGGFYGGGAGGFDASGEQAGGRNGTDGLANSGGGGGGACRDRSNIGTPGNGGSGIIIIRNHR